MNPETKDAQLTTEEEIMLRIQKVLNKFAGAPGKDTIETWKRSAPGGQVSLFSPDGGKRVFIIRALNVTELSRIQTHASARAPEIQVAELQVAVAVTATLWTSITENGKLSEGDLKTGTAGLAPTLNDAISRLSDFVPPDVLDSMMLSL